MRRRAALGALAGWALSSMANCRPERGQTRTPPGTTRIVLKYQPLGESNAFDRLLRSFEREHPNVVVAAEALPTSSDVAHQFFLTALEGQARDFDVFIVDVVWVAEFARAGWLLDLSPFIGPA